MTILETPQPAQPIVARKSQPWDSFLANSKVPQGQTDELLTWLSKVNQKQLRIRGQRGDRDLRKEAMLEAARLSAQAELERKQRERRARWLQHQHVTELTPPPSPPQSAPSAEAGDLCDCDACVLCARHKSSTYGKCYCNMIFSPRPVFMDFTSPLSATDAFSDDKTSIEADKFLASLGGGKRKAASEDTDLASHKRAKAWDFLSRTTLWLW